MGQKMDENGMSSRWQHLHLRDRCENLDPSQQADLLRHLMTHVRWAAAKKVVSSECGSNLFHHYADRYSAVVDSPDERTGMNNFAEGALALLNGRRNESKLWVSGLRKDTVMKLDCVKKAIEASEAVKATLIPPGKESEQINLRPDKTLSVPSKLKAMPSTKPSAQQGPDPVIASELASGLAPAAPHLSKPLFQPAIHAESRGNVTVNQVPESGKNLGGLSSQNAESVQPNPQFQDKSNFYQASVGVNRRGGFWNMSGGGEEEGEGDNSPTWQGGGRNRNVLYPSNNTGNGPCKNGNFGNNQNLPPYKKVEPQKRGFNEVEKEDDEGNQATGFFRTAREQLAIENQKKYGRNRGGNVERNMSNAAYGTSKRSLGTRRGPSSKFVPPVMNKDEDQNEGAIVRKVFPGGGSAGRATNNDEPVDERLKNIEPKMVELVTSEIMDHGPSVSWDDIAGLEFAKTTIKEIVVWPMLRPDIFTGLRGPPKGLLLFGPPGTGKTLIGKCIASQSKSTFFSISASSLTSKWVGEGEKMVRALFAVARVHQPAVIFIDEIDSLLSQRSDGEHEASRRIKTEFLVQLDGACTSSDDRILVVGATNRPQEIDEAARRRFVKRLYIPLPESTARCHIIINLLSQQNSHLTEEELQLVSDKTDGYSGADMANLCREAALGPIRSMSFAEIENVTADQVRPIIYEDFESALCQVKASVSTKELDLYLDWNKLYGSWGR